MKKQYSSVSVLKPLVLFLLMVFGTSHLVNAQLDTQRGTRQYGKTTDGNFTQCLYFTMINTSDTESVCNPQADVDLSDFPSIISVEIQSVYASGFDNTDADTTPTGFRTADTSANMLNTTKCIPPGGSVTIHFRVNSEPGPGANQWPDGNQYQWRGTFSGTVNGTPNSVNSTFVSTRQMFDADVIPGAALTGFQNGGATRIFYGDNLTPNLDGTYDFRYRVTLGNYGTVQATNVEYFDPLDYF